MASKFIVPFELPNYLGTPADHADTGFVLMYVKYGWLKKLTGGIETDMVLQRPLDGFDSTTAYGPIASTDTVLEAFKKIQSGIVNITLTGDVTGTASYDGAGNLVISTTVSGGSGATPGIWATTVVDSQLYGDVTIDGVTNNYGWDFNNLSSFRVSGLDVSLASYDNNVTYTTLDLNSYEAALAFADGASYSYVSLSATRAQFAYQTVSTGESVGVYLTDAIVQIRTNAINAGSGVTGQVLSLVDDTTGEGEWKDIHWSAITDAPAFLTAEADTLDTVTTRGNSTNNSVYIGGTADTFSSNFVVTPRIGIKQTSSAPSALILSDLSLGAMAIVKWRTTDTASMGLPAGHGEIQVGNSGLAIWAHGDIKFGYDNGFRMGLYGATGNVTIGSTDLDSGYKLDVYGTGRIAGAFTSSGNYFLTSSQDGIYVGSDNTTTGSSKVKLYGALTTYQAYKGSTFKGELTFEDTRSILYHASGNTDVGLVGVIPIIRATIAGNVIIGGTLDAGYKADILGTTRVKSSIEQMLRVEHTNGNYMQFTVGNGSAVSTGTIGWGLNGADILQMNSNTLFVNVENIRPGSSAINFLITGGGTATSLVNSITLGSNTVNVGPWTATSGIQNTVSIGTENNAIWSPSSGNAEYNILRITPKINTSGTYSGTVRGIYINPTLTSITGVSFYAIEVTDGKIKLGGLAGATTRMVVADTSGVLMTQPIPGGGGGITADQSIIYALIFG